MSIEVGEVLKVVLRRLLHVLLDRRHGGQRGPLLGEVDHLRGPELPANVRGGPEGPGLPRDANFEHLEYGRIEILGGNGAKSYVQTNQQV